MSSSSSVNHLTKGIRREESVGDDKDREMPARRKGFGSSPSHFSVPPLYRLVEIFVAETLGTGMLMFFGCMSQITWKDEGIPSWQGALVFALVVTTIIQIFGHISAAHLNPAVTLCFVLLGQTTPAAAVVYVIAECIGSILGFGLLKLITPCDIIELSMKHVSENLCSTIPHSSVTTLQAIGLEFLATSCLILVVCGLTDIRNAEKGSANSLKFGATVLAISLTVGPYTGASMNPARTLGPAVWNGSWELHWMYWMAPMLSAFVMTVFYQTMFVRPLSQIDNNEDVPLTSVKVKTHKEETKERK